MRLEKHRYTVGLQSTQNIHVHFDGLPSHLLLYSMTRTYMIHCFHHYAEKENLFPNLFLSKFDDLEERRKRLG